MARRALIKQALMRGQITMKNVHAALRLYDAGDLDGVEALLSPTTTRSAQR